MENYPDFFEKPPRIDYNYGYMPDGFEFLEHTADARLKVWGQTPEELFRNALRGLAFYLKPDALKVKSYKLKEKKEINLEAPDLNSLLVEFLSSVLAKSDIKDTIFVDVKFKKLGDNFLEAKLRGIKTDGFDKEIKAVSYQEVEVKKNPETGFYEAVLIFDI